MESVVSFETAKRLKEAGFPQPNDYKSAGFYFFKTPDNVWRPYSWRTGDEAHEWEHRGVFAPSATDILKEMDSSYMLGYDLDLNRWFLAYELKSEYIGCTAKSKYAIIFRHNDPAEACAAAWLSIHEKNK